MKGCFKINFMVWGPHVKEIRIIQIDQADKYKCIYTHFNRNNANGINAWITEKLLLDVRGEYVKFYIEVLSDFTPGHGFLAIDRIVYDYHWC